MAKPTVTGSFHQGDITCFSENSRGRQCLANSVAAAIYSTQLPINMWTSSSLDRILLAGDELYLRRCDTNFGYLQLQDIHETEMMFLDQFLLNRQNPMTGLIIYQRAPSGPFFSLTRAITAMENPERWKYGILTIADETSNGASMMIAVRQGNYYMFDPHGRDRYGNVQEGGTSVLLNFTSKVLFVRYIKNLANQLVTTQFELTPLSPITIGHHRMLQPNSSQNTNTTTTRECTNTKKSNDHQSINTNNKRPTRNTTKICDSETNEEINNSQRATRKTTTGNIKTQNVNSTSTRGNKKRKCETEDEIINQRTTRSKAKRNTDKEHEIHCNKKQTQNIKKNQSKSTDNSNDTSRKRNTKNAKNSSTPQSKHHKVNNIDNSSKTFQANTNCRNTRKRHMSETNITQIKKCKNINSQQNNTERTTRSQTRSQTGSGSRSSTENIPNISHYRINKEKNTQNRKNQMIEHKKKNKQVIDDNILNETGENDLSPNVNSPQISSQLHENDNIINNNADEIDVFQSHDNETINMEHCLQLFNLKISNGPIYVCTICLQTWFFRSVSNLSNIKISSQVEQNKLNQCRQNYISVDNKEWICRTCRDSIKNGRIPKLSIENKMGFPVQPNQLKILNGMEERFTSPRLTLFQMRTLPCGGQISVRGNSVNLPIDVAPTVDMLPRTLDNTETIAVNLKRRMCYKGCAFKQENVRPAVVWSAVNYLMTHSQMYKDLDIQLDTSWIQNNTACNCDETNEIIDSDHENENVNNNEQENENIMKILTILKKMKT